MQQPIAIKIIVLSLLLLVSFQPLSAQDFILHVPLEASVNEQRQAVKLQEQAESIGQAGFTYVWLPLLSRRAGSTTEGSNVKDFYDLGAYGQGPTQVGTQEEVLQLLRRLQANDVNVMASMVYHQRCGGKVSELSDPDDSTSVRYAFTDFSDMPSGRGSMDASFFDVEKARIDTSFRDCLPYNFSNPAVRAELVRWTNWMWQTIGVRGLHYQRADQLSPAFVAGLLNDLRLRGLQPPLFVGDFPSTKGAALGNWIDSVQQYLGAKTRTGVDVRLLDYPLQRALARACDSTTQFDVRTVLTTGMVENQRINPFSAVTFAQPIADTTLAKQIRQDPLLAYAYLLTNNQVGLPVVHYQDYFDLGLKPEIDRLLTLHKQYIYQASTAYYLNAGKTPYLADYTSGAPATSLIYQLSGGVGEREIIVAINFASEPLSVLQELDSTNWLVGDTLTDVLGRSEFPYTTLEDGHQVRLEVPARSFTVWVQGRVPVMPSLNGVEFSIAELDGFIELSWENEREQNIQGYEIQRSINGKQFEPIAWVPPSGDGASLASYLHLDHDIFENETVYYRIKSVTDAEHFEYSAVEKLYIEAPVQQSIEVRPTAASGQKVVIVHTANAQLADIQVFDASKKLVRTYQLDMQVGKNQQLVDLSNLSNGVYFIKVTTAGQTEKLERIVKHQ